MERKIASLHNLVRELKAEFDRDAILAQDIELRCRKTKAQWEQVEQEIEEAVEWMAWEGVESDNAVDPDMEEEDNEPVGNEDLDDYGNRVGSGSKSGRRGHKTT